MVSLFRSAWAGMERQAASRWLVAVEYQGHEAARQEVLQEE